MESPSLNGVIVLYPSLNRFILIQAVTFLQLPILFKMLFPFKKAVLQPGALMSRPQEGRSWSGG